MKRFIFTLFSLFYLTTLIYAQENWKGIDFSFKSGLTFANQYGKDADSETFLNGRTPEQFYANHAASSQFKTGFNFGVLAEYRFNSFFSIGSGLNYIQKGSFINVTNHWSSDKQNYEAVSGDVYWNQNYWNIDLPIKVYYPIKNHEFNILTGLTFGLLSNANETGSIQIEQIEYEYENDRGANEREIGFLLGLGYAFQLPNRKSSITIDLIWNRSFGNSYGGDLIPNPQEYYNQTVNLLIGYKFRLND